MGRRSRKRGQPSPEPRATAQVQPARASASPRRRRRGDPPPAPWGSFPLVELCILAALAVGITGIVIWGSTGRLMLAGAAALGSLAGLELSVREHFAGYRSHTTLLAATAAVASLAVLFFAGAPRNAMLAVAAVIFVSAFALLREAFKRRSGGLGFR